MPHEFKNPLAASSTIDVGSEQANINHVFRVILGEHDMSRSARDRYLANNYNGPQR